LVFGVKHLPPAQDVDLSLAYPQFEHLIGQDRGVDEGGPRLTLNLPSGARSAVRVQPSHIKRISDASERLMESPYGEKAGANFRPAENSRRSAEARKRASLRCAEQ